MKLFTSDSRIKEAVQYAEEYFSSEDFYRDILSINKYENANVSSKEIENLFRKFFFENHVVEIKVTNFGFFYRRVLGRTVGDGFAYVNSFGLNRMVWSVGATVVHEVGHVVDEFFPGASFGHGSNSSNGKGMTFPYFIQERAENYIKKQVLKKELNRLSMVTVLKREGVA